MKSLISLLVGLLTLISSVLAQDAKTAAVLVDLLGSDNLKGGTTNLNQFTLGITANATHAVAIFNISQSYRQVGWAAFGGGTRMTNADFLIVWPNPSSGDYTISHRSAPFGHGEPVTDDTTQEGISIIPALSTNATDGTPYTQIALLRELSPSYQTTSSNAALQRAAGQDIVYAYCRTNPGSTSIDATLDQHERGAFGRVTINLSRNIRFATVPNPSGGGNETVVEQPTGGEETPAIEQPTLTWTRHDSLIVIHALCGCIAWLIISPAMVLLGRLGRQINGWVKYHRLFQVLLTVPLTVVAVVVGSLAVSNGGGSHFEAGHPLLGLMMLIILVIQAPLGAYIHHKYDPKRTKRPIRNVFHMVIGLTLTVLGFIQIFKGMRLYAEDDQRTAPGYIWALYYIIVGCVSLAILISIGRVIQQRKMAGYSWKDSFFGLGRNTPDPYGVSPYASVRKSQLQSLHVATNSQSTINSTASLDFDQYGHEMNKVPALVRTQTAETINSEKNWR